MTTEIFIGPVLQSKNPAERAGLRRIEALIAFGAEVDWPIHCLKVARSEGRECSREDSNLHVLPARFSKPCPFVNKHVRTSLTPVNVMPMCMPDVVYSQAARQTVLL